MVNTINDKTSPEMVEEIICHVESSLALDLQPPSSIEFQNADDGLEAETCDQMMQDDYVPLCFEEFQFLKEKFHSISKEKDEKPIESHAVPLELMENRLQYFFQVFHDPIADVLEDMCSNVLDGMEINMNSYEDHFATFWRSTGGLMLCNFIKIQSVFNFSWELPSSSSLFLLISNHLQRIQIAVRMLTWLHWLFHFT